MKKIYVGISAILMAVAMAGSASAIGYYEEFTNNVWLDANNTNHTWTFDLDNDALYAGWLVNPYGTADINAEDTINSALFSLGFFDDETREGIIFREEKEYGGLVVDGTTWLANEEISAGDSILLANVTGMLTDHILTVRVDRISGDFGVDFTSLCGDFTDNPAPSPVPEPGTMMLLGSGLVGLAGYGRKRMKK